MKLALNYFGIYFSVTVSFFCLYLLSFKTSFFSDQSVLMYRGCFLLIALIIIYSGGILYLYRKKYAHIESYGAALVIAISISFSFLVLVPVTVDRSISTFVLHEISSQKACLVKKDIEDAFLKKYVFSQQAINRRLREQTLTGTISTSSQGCVTLTSKGRFLEHFFSLIYEYFTDHTK